MAPRSTQLRLGVWRERELVVDLFAGGGGASEGIARGLGRHPDIAINHDPAAVAMHAANHPTTKHYCESVFKVAPREAVGGRPVGLLWLSPDCFPAGTLVLTREGYRPIEQIEVDDEVLTHERRWRRVTSTMSTVRPLVRVRGHGHPGITVSAEHPFLARHRADRWNNERRSYDRTLEPQAWVPAGDLDRGWYWASPTEFPSDTPPAVSSYRGRTLTIDSDVMWLAGRYVADGWTRLTETRAELVLTCGMHEVEGLRSRLERWTRAGARSRAEEMAWHERATATAYQFTTSHRGLVEWLRAHFGHGASEKSVPGWALGMARGFREAFLSGYLSGDGSRAGARNEIVECQTVSRALAFGIKALAASLGKTAAVYVAANRSTIEGRLVNARAIFTVRWRDELDAAHRQTFRENGLEWAPIREREDLDASAEVFNLSVEEDESYVVEGLVVHNCTHHSKAKGGKPRKKKIRGLAWVAVRWARDVAPRVIALENVEEFADWGPLGPDDRPDAARRGKTFRAFVAKLRRYGYEVEHRILVAADYGAPTTRRRLFLIARRDGQPITWPKPSHGKTTRRRWRAAAEVIDWSLPCPSIFDRARPLAEATLRRIALGVRRYVLEHARPFIVPVTHPRDARVHSIDEPVRTVTAANRGELALIAPTLVQTGYGERPGQTPRSLDLARPLGTVVAGGAKHALVAALITKHYGGVVGHDVERPLGTVTTQDHHSLTTVALTRGDRRAEVRAFLMAYYGGERGDARVASLTDPLRTVTTAPRFGLVTVEGEDYAIADIGMRMLCPRELFRAQGFGDHYVIDPLHDGKPLTKTEQIAKAGNSVPPPIVEAIVRANVREREEAAA